MDDTCNAVLEECAGELESGVKRATKRVTGQLANSWQHKVVDSEHTAYIGSNLERSIFYELGTGEHALNGDGRKGGWAYKDEKGDWHFTRGQKPKRPFYKTYIAMKNAIIKRIQDAFKGLSS